MRLDPLFRALVYAVFAVLVVSGAVWFAAEQMKESPDDMQFKSITATMLMIHGGAAMIALMAIGALVPMHMYRGWRARMNRVTGALVGTLNTLLIVTAFALYYIGSEALRPWISDLHLVVGAAIPIFLILHIWWGRSARVIREQEARRRVAERAS